MQRYFVALDKTNNIVFSEQDVFHITKVMRCHIGEHIEVVINNDAFEAEIDSLNPIKIHLVGEKKRNNELTNDLILFSPLLKSDKTELVLQKATELGVTKIVFFDSSRSIIRLSQKDFDKKLDRYRLIVKEASEQCHRNVIPEIIGLLPLKEINSHKADINLVAYEEESGKENTIFKAFKPNSSISFIFGPEGGFDKKEIDILSSFGFSLISLGKRILRAETASFYGLSIISSLMEEENE